MLGCLPPESLAALRERYRAKSRSSGRRCHVTARLKEIDAVEVSAERGGETLRALRLLLGLAVREGLQQQQSLREGLRELMREAECIKAASLNPSAFTDEPSALESAKSG